MKQTILVTCISSQAKYVNEVIKATTEETVIRSSVSSIEDINNWVEEYAKNTQTKWNFRSSKPTAKRFVCSKLFVCHHSAFRKVPKEENRKGLSKNSACPATLSVKIKLNTMSTRNKDAFVKKGLCGIITIKECHNHTLRTAKTLRFLPADKSVKEAFRQYFRMGMGIADSCKYHQSLLELDEEITEEDFASGRVNPTERTVRHWHDQWTEANLGPRSGQGVTDKIKQMVQEYAKKGILIMFSEEPFAIAIVTPLMKRAHNLPNACNIVFVDSTSACDAERHTVTFLLTACAAGAVPLAVLITQGQSQESYVAGFMLLKEGVPEKFAGLQFPKIFVTDQSQAEMNALKAVWPHAKNYLCVFHVCQAVWRWLWDSHHAIPMDERKTLMRDFQSILYAESINECEEAYSKAQAGNTFPQWQKYLSEYWKFRELWCLAWRSSSMKGHNTNNFSEVSVRLFKDIVLSRVKVYNALHLVYFSCSALDSYYCKRLRNFANSRAHNARLLLNNLIEKSNYLTKEDIVCTGEHEFLVPSEKNPKILYTINVKGGWCSCPVGRYGQFCKHQSAVYRHFQVIGANLPPVTAADRYTIAKLALGDKAPSPEFYEPFQIEASTTQSEEAVVICEAPSPNAAEPLNDFEPLPANKSAPNTAVEFNDILSLMSSLHDQFGASNSGLKALSRRLNRKRSVGQWETFLHTAGCHIPLRHRDGVPIRVQPTSTARRTSSSSRGNKRLKAGRLAKPKRKRNLGENISQNRPNAKSHT